MYETNHALKKKKLGNEDIDHKIETNKLKKIKNDNRIFKVML